MRRVLIVAVAGVAVGLAGSAFAADAAAGKAVFDSAKPACKGCHTDAKHPLTKIGATAKPEDLKAWVRTPKEQMAKEKKTGVMPAYPAEKISDADLDNLVAYLSSLK
jgi:mono/diheme cytochrome c family protein